MVKDLNKSKALMGYNKEQPRSTDTDGSITSQSLVSSPSLSDWDQEREKYPLSKNQNTTNKKRVISSKKTRGGIVSRKYNRGR